MIWIGKTCPKSMFSLSVLLTSLQILQYFLCQLNYSDIGVTSRRHAVTLKNMEKSVEPHQWSLYWRKHRSRCQAFDLITCKADGIKFPGLVECADGLTPSTFCFFGSIAVAMPFPSIWSWARWTQSHRSACASLCVCAPLCKCTNVSITCIMIWYYDMCCVTPVDP
jgi:hypothetical protein